MPSRCRVSPSTSGDAADDQARVLVGARHRLLDQPSHHPGGGQADRVGAVPGRRQVDHAELPAGDRVVDRRGPADPVVHDRGVVLGGEDHGRTGVSPVGQVKGVGADAFVVPAAAGHEVHRLGLAAHHPAAVGPQDASVGVGDREHEVAVLGSAPQLVLDARDRDLQWGTHPEAWVSASSASGACLTSVVMRRRTAPTTEDLRADQLLRAVAVLDERGPGADGIKPARSSRSVFSSRIPGVLPQRSPPSTLAVRRGSGKEVRSGGQAYSRDHLGPVTRTRSGRRRECSWTRMHSARDARCCSHAERSPSSSGSSSPTSRARTAGLLMTLFGLWAVAEGAATIRQAYARVDQSRVASRPAPSCSCWVAWRLWPGILAVLGLGLSSHAR